MGAVGYLAALPPRFDLPWHLSSRMKPFSPLLLSVVVVLAATAYFLGAGAGGGDDPSSGRRGLDEAPTAPGAETVTSAREFERRAEQRRASPTPPIGSTEIGSSLSSTFTVLVTYAPDANPSNVQAIEIARDQRDAVSRNIPEDGALDYSADVLRGGQILFVGQGVESRVLNIPAEPGEFYEVYLAASASISGRVVRSDGGPVPAGTQVVAWQLGEQSASDLKILRTVPESARRRMTAPVGEDGLFELSGVGSGHFYGLSAFGRGWATLSGEERSPVQAPSQGQEVSVRPVYCAALRLVEKSSGTPIGMDNIGYSFKDDFSHLPFQLASDAGLSGKIFASEHLFCTAVDWANESDESGVEYLMWSGDSSPTSLPLEIRVCGYQDRSVDLPLSPLGAVAPAPVAVELERRAEGVALVKIRFSGEAVQLPKSPSISSGHLKCSFRPLYDANEPTQVFMLDPYSYPTWDIGLIVAGDYAVRLECPAGGWRSAEKEVQIVAGSGEAQCIDFLSAEAGSLLLDVIRESGAPYTGTLGFVLLKRDDQGLLGTDGTSDAFFARPPYFIPAVEPGDWCVHLLIPFVSRGGGTQDSVAEIVGGRLVEHLMVVR